MGDTEKYNHPPNLPQGRNSPLEGRQRRVIEKLQYITQETDSLTHIDCVREACIAGVKWVQLRVKEKPTEEYLEIAKEARIICDLYDARLIINDNVEVAIKSNADGVHLGKSDMQPHEARKLLGAGKIIGGTANTIEDIKELINNAIDYIGLGPFKNTQTKKNLSPLLGLEGYYQVSQQLFDLLKDAKLNYNIPPILAIGGIQKEDVVDLMNAGVYGVAVSGLLTNNFDIAEELTQLIEQKNEICYE